jgi:hypothetical protein
LNAMTETLNDVMLELDNAETEKELELSSYEKEISKT